MQPQRAMVIQMVGWCLVLGLTACGVGDQGQVQAPDQTPTPAKPTLSAERQTEAVHATAFAAMMATQEAWMTPDATRDAMYEATRIAHPTATYYPTETPGPSPIPIAYRSLQGSGFLQITDDLRFMNSRYERYTTIWRYDQGDSTLMALGGARMFDKGPQGVYRLEEPYQGILLTGRAHSDEAENFLFDPQPLIDLPVRDGPAWIVDGHVQGDQMLLTIKTTGGSVYVFDVLHRSLSAAQPPSVEAGGPYLAAPGETIRLVAQGQDAAGVQLEYAWDLDADGSFETAGQAVPFATQNLPNGSNRTVGVRVTSKSGLSATAQALVQIQAPVPTLVP